MLNQLARARGRRDAAPIVEVAETIIKRRNAKAIHELVASIGSATAAVQGDAIKVLYEMGGASQR